MASRVEGVTGSPKLGPPQHEGQVCRQCLMDTSDPEIAFDEHGVCNHCHGYHRRMREDLPAGDRRTYLEGLVARIRKAGAGRPYDCVIGVSGGVDSTYVAWLCKKELGLRPLAVHLDNGWNTELAVRNIETVLRRLDIDLYTHVIDWEEFRDLQVAFLKSGIANWELPTDHAIRALLYREAARRGIKHIITGSNLATEAVMPSAWMADNVDLRLLTSIHRRFGTRKLKTFPRMSLLRLAWYTFARRIRQIPILNYVDYHKSRAMELLERELGWQPYEFKHGESQFTRFFQRHYLPRRFGYDKRKAHLSNLILSGQITRDEGLAGLNAPLYYPDELDRDLAYVAKKLEMTPAELAAHIENPPRRADDYPNSNWIRRRLPTLVAIARRVATARNFTTTAPRNGGYNLHIYPSPISRESRIFRITEALDKWSLFDRIFIVGMQDGAAPSHQSMGGRREIVRIRPSFRNSRNLFLRLARFISWYYRTMQTFRHEPIACVNSHSLSTLPLGWMLKRVTRAKLVYDTHELETETLNMRGARRWLAKLTEALFISSADAVVVVSPKIAEWYAARYPGISPLVVRNLPQELYAPGRLDLFREHFGIPSDALVFFYQGLLDEGRGIDVILDAFARVGADRHVVFLGFGSQESLIVEYAHKHTNIHFMPAVPPNQVRKYTSSGDVGLCIGQPVCLSYIYSLPNKLFEYMGSGVAVVATKLPEIAKVIESSGSGWTVENDSEHLARLVETISREQAVQRGTKGAQWTKLNTWEKECEVLKSVYDKLEFTATNVAEPQVRAPVLVVAETLGR
ncbi:MAG: N-acetyl sugar amidotransferase [Enhydrobacter sp.]|nr:MAG: N-acetyl sugar amidotransferase [Enhydrobacter sp.]